MHYADVDLELASLGTNRRENVFMVFPAVKTICACAKRDF